MNDDISKIFDRLGREQKKELLSEILSRLQISGGGGSFEDQYSKGIGYGGRIGYRQPLANGAFTVGVSGQGYKVDTPFGKFSDRKITGGDLGYEFGDNKLALKYDENGVMGGVPLRDLLQLIYTRRF